MKSVLAWIKSAGYIGPGGAGLHNLKAAMLKGNTLLKAETKLADNCLWSGRIPDEAESLLLKYDVRHRDRSVQLGMLAASEAMDEFDKIQKHNMGIAMGTSRGPTETWEKFHTEFLARKKLSPFTSPLTTPGILASAIAENHNINGPELTLSMTCSSSLLALINGLAWLNCGWCDLYLAGGAEAPLTAFTIAQAKALHLLSMDLNSDWPCRPLELNPQKNTMVLAEAAACVVLQKPDTHSSGYAITGFGASRENAPNATGMNSNGEGFISSMQQALNRSPGPVDLICVHAPGTLVGDSAELRAIQQVFKEQQMPVLYPVKAIMGHSYGASGIISILAAMNLMEGGYPIPSYLQKSEIIPPVRRVMINAAGFGAQISCIIIEKIEN